MQTNIHEYLKKDVSKNNFCSEISNFLIIWYISLLQYTCIYTVKNKITNISLHIFFKVSFLNLTLKATQTWPK